MTMPMYNVLLCGASCVLHSQIWPFGLLSRTLTPPVASSSPRLTSSCLLQFVCIMKIPNLHSNMKSARVIIPMAGALFQEAWCRLPSCSHACMLPQECDLNHINLLNFFCVSFLVWKERGLGFCKNSQESLT